MERLLDAIRYHEEEAEKYRFLGKKLNAAEHLRKAKELIRILMLND
jgi:hypothetical protein